jgi:hypothetical protein
LAKAFVRSVNWQAFCNTLQTQQKRSLSAPFSNFELRGLLAALALFVHYMATDDGIVLFDFHPALMLFLVLGGVVLVRAFRAFQHDVDVAFAFFSHERVPLLGDA